VICSRRSEGAIQSSQSGKGIVVLVPLFGKYLSVNCGPGKPPLATASPTWSSASKSRAWRDMHDKRLPSLPQFSITMSTPLTITVSENENVEARGVRFDDECVLIPGPQHRSRMTKLLAKPSAFIFKRKPSHHDPQSPISPRDCDAPQSPTSPRSA
jgi:hypothetical protein